MSITTMNIGGRMMKTVNGLTGRVVTPQDLEYNEARQEWNRAIQKFPAAIVYCRSKNDVSNAVLWSRRNGKQLRIRNGGHNYEGYSVGNGVLVIDTSEMNGIVLNEEENTLKVQGGVTNGELYAFLSPSDNAFPGGTCPTVGVSGYALGGGWGLSCRNFGLGCDSLKEIELVNYEGRILRADRKHNYDLFWACRGAGGGNFGVVVSMTFTLPPKPDRVTLIRIEYKAVDQEKQKRYLEAWQNWLKAAGEKLTLISRLFNADERGLGIMAQGICYAPPEEAEALLEPLTSLGGAEVRLQYLTFYEAVTEIGAQYPDSEMFRSASRFVLRDFTDAERAGIVELIRVRPAGSVYTGLSLYALGGKVAEVSRYDSAFYYRKARYIIYPNTTFEDRKFIRQNSEWVSRSYRYLERLTEGSYVNFPYAGIRDFLRAYYGQNDDRLRVVKAKYDPLDVFTFPQGIGVADSAEEYR